VWMHMCSCLG